MLDSIINYRKATFQDVDQICFVLMDFYNMDNAKEASNAFRSEMEKVMKDKSETRNSRSM